MPKHISCSYAVVHPVALQKQFSSAAVPAAHAAAPLLPYTRHDSNSVLGTLQELALACPPPP